MHVATQQRLQYTGFEKDNLLLFATARYRCGAYTILIFFSNTTGLMDKPVFFILIPAENACAVKIWCALASFTMVS